MRRLIHTDTNLLARFKELTDSLESCQIAKVFHEIERYKKSPTIFASRKQAISMCKELCPDSFNHIPIHKDIAHVIESWHDVNLEHEIPYVCQISGCKIIHENQEPEELEAINTELEAINTELPAPKNTTYKCHHCEAGFRDETSIINHVEAVHNAKYSKNCHHCEAGFRNNTALSFHIKIIHNAENSNAVKSVSKPVVEETDNKTLEASHMYKTETAKETPETIDGKEPPLNIEVGDKDTSKNDNPNIHSEIVNEISESEFNMPNLKTELKEVIQN